MATNLALQMLRNKSEHTKVNPFRPSQKKTDTDQQVVETFDVCHFVGNALFRITTQGSNNT